MTLVPLAASRSAAPARMLTLNALRSAVYEGQFEPGQRLTERELLQLTGTSRTTLRETLRQLETEGLVAIVPGKGLVIASLSIKQAGDIYTVREGLEVFAAEQFVANASQADITVLRKSLALWKATCGGDDLARMVLLKDDVYRAFFAGTHNSYLEEIMSALHGRIWQLRRLSLSVRGRPAQSTKEVARLVNALARRDVQEAKEAAAAHVRAARPVAIGQLEHHAANVG